MSIIDLIVESDPQKADPQKADPQKADNPWKDNVCARMYPGMTMSLWMEALRQGVQDYKRLWCLKNSGMSDDEITAHVLQMIPRGEDAPWGGAEPGTYSQIRERLDDLIILKMQR